MFEHATLTHMHLHAYMGVQMYAHKHTHTHGCCSSNLLGYRADVTAPFTITGPNLHHKRQEGPNAVAQWSGQKPTGAPQKHIEGENSQTVH